jgi:lipopolysaccharide/colanic/teichoic acid biosynthesis glycosyltransferase
MLDEAVVLDGGLVASDALHAVPDDRPGVLTSSSKRAFDVFVASVILLLVIPIWLVMVVSIRATSPGPAIFRQERIGARGRPFVIWKFRTMHNGVPDISHRQFVTTEWMKESSGNDQIGRPFVYKLNSDPRITRVGSFLRKTSIDEVPQLINVLRGEMSLVGPRPPLAYEVAQYEPWQLERLSTRPGITGLWQVSGRNRLSHRQMCELDIRYVRDWNLALDVKIAIRTPWVMLVDRGGAS